MADLAWYHPDEPRDALDATEQDGWSRAARGELPALPDWALTPADTWQYPLGTTVRFVNDEETSSGVSFRRGEEATVIEHRLAPIGAVIVTARTPDGRVFMTGAREMLVAST